MLRLPRPETPHGAALLVAGVYAGLSGLWIALSDGWVAAMFNDPAQLTRAQTFKGWFFVAASSVIIFFLVRRAVRAHRARARMGARLRVVLDTLPGRVYWKDQKLRFQGCNLAFAEAAGLPGPESIAGLTPEDLPEPPPAPAWWVEGEREALASGGTTARRELHLPSEGGSTDRWFEATHVRLAGDEGKLEGVLTFSREITEEKLVEERLRHGQKIQALGEVTGGVAHDFKNVLAVIQGNTEFLVDLGAEVPPEAREAVLDLQRATESASGIVGKLLAFGRRSAFRPQRTSIPELVREVGPLVSRLVPSGHSFHVHLAEDVPAAKADPSAVEQAVLNLVTNARDALGVEGEIELRVEAVTLDGSSSPSAGHVIPGEPPAPGSYVTLSVRDSGAGMEPDVLRSACTPFFTTKPRGRGTGLGLPMVRELMEAMEGGMSLRSAPGRGTEVTLYFPVASGLDDGRMDGGQVKPAPEEAGAETVLVVDDQDAMRRVTTRLLERRGFQTLTAASGREALDLIRARASEIDLVLSDLVMEDMSGLELHRALVAEGRGHLAFLFMTGADDLSALGATSSELARLKVIAKPWDTATLTHAIRATLDRAEAPAPPGSDRPPTPPPS
jgi:signal transduction histidine kinase/ActR/RegA family two-component response regulator